MAALDVVQVGVPMILAAIDLTRLDSVAFWDALIVRAAQAGGCRLLATEDLQHGQSFGDLRVENPFR